MEEALERRMAAWFLQRLTLQAMKTENNCIARCLGKHLVQKTAPAQLSVTVSVLRLPSLIHAKAFSVAEEAQKKKKKKKETEAAFISVGRKIRDGIVQVFDEKGNDLGHMQQADVIELMNTRELRLVKRITRAEPPVYQLMTGLQIHEERMKLREREKAEPKTGSPQTAHTHTEGRGPPALDSWDEPLVAGTPEKALGSNRHSQPPTCSRNKEGVIRFTTEDRL
ncbi:translation initiation factor IF-3, mitochondrial isoform X2 [Loxodonta africana]|uniref:translation initiation factor IF-3, mitochondrial isoform X2 n=1 Tax=Loxodonta africana TaxID=9785 RepID=UPI0030D5503D